MTWSKYEITGTKTAEIWNAIQNSFEAVFIAAGAPDGAAMYYSSETPGKDITLYLSPAATVLFSPSAWKFHPCSKPPFAGLLVGDDRDRF